ncbi:MAG: hypothetical protein V4564_07700 [Pseudomonadota bacterium]
MTDASLLPAVRAALRANELGPANPYRLSFADLGKSGASIGIFQADTAANHGAWSALHQILTNAGMATAKINSVMATLSAPCNSTSIALCDLLAVNAALATPQGQQTVNDLDEVTLDTVLRHVDQATAAATAQGKTIEPRGLLMIALWVNMTGAPNMFCSWIGGTTVAQVRPPPNATVSANEIECYLRAQQYFTTNPRTIPHFLASVAAGAALLP